MEIRDVEWEGGHFRHLATWLIHSMQIGGQDIWTKGKHGVSRLCDAPAVQFNPFCQISISAGASPNAHQVLLAGGSGHCQAQSPASGPSQLA